MAMLRPFQDVPFVIPPNGDRYGYFAGLEAAEHKQNTGTADVTINLLRLDGGELEDWAHETGSFSNSAQVGQKGVLKSRIRLLLAQARSEYRSPVPEKLATGSVLQALGLPLNTFASFAQASGVFSIHTHPHGSTVDKCEQLNLIVHSPHKWGLSIGGLAVSHDFTTGTTKALILGYAFDLDRFTTQAPGALQHLVQHIREGHEYWCHPLFLPSVFIVRHAIKTRGYIRDFLSEEVVKIETNVGTTQAGRTTLIPASNPNPNEVLYVDGQLQRENAKRLTASINNLSTQIIFIKRSPRWSIDCTGFLLDILSGSQRLQQYRDVSAPVFLEVLEYVRNFSEANLEVTETSEARMKLQLDILYTAVAQDDGQTSARLAASSGKDSTSMKILALITAAYLPGTFVASLFSMGMFDWFGGSNGSVASSFWIYWAVAVPLTVITLVGWGFWWQVEKARFEINVQKMERPKESHKFLGPML